jgi:prepilin peptidase CpaA
VHGFAVLLEPALAALVVTDLRWRRLPNAVVLPLWAAGLVAWAVVGGWRPLAIETGASLALAGPAMIAWQGGLCGGGDVKLCGALGAWLGLEGGLYALAGGLLLSGLWAGGQLLIDGELRREVAGNLLAAVGSRALSAPVRPKRKTVPFGAALALAGAVVALLGGGPHA